MNCLYNLLFTCRIVSVSISPISGIRKLKFKQNIIIDESFVLKGLILLLLARLYNLKSFLLNVKCREKQYVYICAKLPEWYQLRFFYSFILDIEFPFYFGICEFERSICPLISNSNSVFTSNDWFESLLLLSCNM